MKDQKDQRDQKDQKDSKDQSWNKQAPAGGMKDPKTAGNNFNKDMDSKKSFGKEKNGADVNRTAGSTNATKSDRR